MNDIQEELVKLKALSNKCNKLMNLYFSSVPTVDLDNIYKQFISVKDKLHKLHPNLFEGNELQDYKKFNQTLGKGYYESFAVQAVKDDITYYIDIAQDFVTISIPNLKLTNEGLFFSGQYFEALSKLVDLISTAKADIIFIDGYVNEKILNIFSITEGNISIKILTKSVSASFTTLVSEFNKSFNNKLEVKTNDEFHDRFLILDQDEFYHIGASMKDAGNRGFMFSRIEEPFIKKQLLEKFNEIWL